MTNIRGRVRSLARFVKRLTKLVLALVLIAVVLILAVAVIGAVRLRSRLARAHIPTVAQLAPPEVPDSENAAVVYTEAFAKMGSLATFSEINNKVRYFVEPEERKRDPGLWEDTEEILLRLRPAVRLIEQAQTRRKCRFAVDWGAWPNLDTQYQYAIRDGIEVLAAQAIVSARKGRMADAVKAMETALDLGESVKDEPLYVSQLRRWRAVSRINATLTDCVRYGHLTGDQADHLRSLLSRIDLVPGRYLALQAEAASSLWEFKVLRRGPKEIAQMTDADMMHGWPETPINKTAFSYLWWAAFHDLDQCEYLDMLEKERKMLPLTYGQIASRGLPNQADVPSYAFVTRTALRYQDTELQRWYRTAAKLRGIQVYLALLAYRDRHGEYPDTLRELWTQSRLKPLKDPFTGRDFIYRREGHQFILYSVGANLQDDEGTSVRYPSKATSDDISWKSKPDPVAVPPPQPSMHPGPGLKAVPTP